MLQEEKARSESILKTAQVIILVLDTSGKIVSFNPYLEEISGYRLKEVKGKDWFSTFLPKCDYVKIRKLFKKAACDIDIKGNINPIVIKSGEQRIIEWNTKTLKDDKGNVKGVLSIGQDITARKKADDKLKASEELLSLFVKHSPIYAFIKDVNQKESRVLFASENYQEMVGIKSSDMIGKTMYELFPAELAKKITDDDWNVISSGKILKVEEVLKDHNYYTLKFPISQGGKNLLAGYTIDITDRKKAEKEMKVYADSLQESQQQYKRLFENSPVSLWVNDFSYIKKYIDSLRKKGVSDLKKYFRNHPEAISKCVSLMKIINVNQATLKTYKARSKKELVGKYGSILRKDIYPGFLEMLIAISKGASSFESEGVNYTLAGDRIDIYMKWVIAFDAEEKYSKVILSVLDITERKKADKKLKESEEKLKSIIEHSDEIYFIHDTEHNMKYISPQSKNLLGYSVKEALQKWTNFITDSPLNKESVGIIEKSMRTGKKAKPYMLELKKKNGTLALLEVNSTPFKDDKGNVLGMTGAVRDITKQRDTELAKELFAANLRRSEEQYKSLFEDAPISLWLEDFSGIKKCIDSLRDKGVLDFKKYFNDHHDQAYKCAERLKIIDVNKATLKTYKARNKKEILRNLHKIFNEETFPVFVKQLVAISKGITSFEAEGINYTLAGERINIYIKWVVSLGGGGKYSRMILSVVDITDRKKAVAAMIKNDKKLRNALSIKAKFASMVSHELRTPLTAIKEGIGIVLDSTAGELNGHQKNFLNIAKRNVDRLHRLINDVLDFSKLEDGRMKFNLEKADLCGVIEEAIASYTPVIVGKGLHVQTNLAQNICEFKFDRDKLTQVMGNLLNNAVKFTEHGGITVNVMYDNRKKNVSVSVKDTGIGVAQKELKSMFHKFIQHDSGGYRNPGGSGLGLAITKEIITGHGGDIWAESKLGKGTEIKFTLPVKPQIRGQKGKL